MGREVETNVRCGGESAVCKVLLECGEIVLRGAIKRRFKFDAISKLAVRGGKLNFRCDPEDVAIQLGDSAETWLDTIRNPRTRVQKLGVAVGQQVCTLGSVESGACDEITSATGSAPRTRLARGCDLVLYFADDAGDLDRLKRIKEALADGGAIWVLWPKGRRDFAHELVVAAARAAGLVQTKSMGFSDMRTGLRLVRPKAALKQS